MKKPFILLLSALSLTAVAQNSSFDKFKQQQNSKFGQFKESKQAEFDAFRKRINEQYAEFMRKQWEAFPVHEADKPVEEQTKPPVVYTEPKPQPAPQPTPQPTPQPKPREEEKPLHDKIWGGDRAFFAQETLFYPYCDCEDRAILFSRLVRDLVGLDVVLLYYPGHLATAVAFNEEVNGDWLSFRNRKYIVCDPTYINAGVGRTMPNMNNQQAQIIALK